MKRRRILAALGATGVAAVAGIGFATEDSVRYTVASEEVDCEDFKLEAEWRETVDQGDGTVLLEDTTSEERGDEPMDPAVIDLGDIKPHDSGFVSFRLEVVPEEENGSVTVTPTLGIELEGKGENGINEPEATANDSSSGEGELQDFLSTEVWIDEGLFGIDMFGGDNLEPNLTETRLTDGTLADVAGSLNGEDLATLSEGESVTVTFGWEFDPDADPRDVNITQTDSVTFTFDIHATCAQPE